MLPQFIKSSRQFCNRNNQTVPFHFQFFYPFPEREVVPAEAIKERRRKTPVGQTLKDFTSVPHFLWSEQVSHSDAFLRTNQRFSPILVSVPLGAGERR